MNTEKTPLTAVQEKYFLNTFPLINLIVLQKLNYSDYAEDIKQKVALSLWKWKVKRSEKELSEEEWLKLSNTSAQNEIKRFYSSQMRQTISLTEISEIEELKITEISLPPAPIGNTKIEAASLLLQIWKVIKEQTLREKFALLLKNREIINHLLTYQCSHVSEIAGTLELTTDEFLGLYHSLPLSDKEIGVCLGKKLNKEIRAEQVFKARQRMRAKLRPFQQQ